MRVTMFTNTYPPMLGGVERAVASTAHALRHLGHDCLVVTPRTPGMEEGEPHTVRLPAVEGLGATGFSYRLPGAGDLRRQIREFLPDVVHAHHPFMLGETGLRQARIRGVPLVFTCHTRWERFVPAGRRLLARLARQLPVVFANVCDLVIAPTPSIARLLRRRGVLAPLTVVPTGVDLARFASGSGQRARERWGIGAAETVIGHVGRLVPEKNLEYLADAVVEVLRQERARFLLVGEGRSAAEVGRRLAAAGVGERLIATGRLDGEALADAYAAMDVFAFTSRTDTQGLVLLEAAAAGCPVVALDAPGPRDLIGREGGLLVPLAAPPVAFAAALLRALEPGARQRLARGARETARDYDLATCTHRLIAAYDEVIRRCAADGAGRPWLRRIWWRIVAEWDLLGQKAALAGAMLR